jgi:hypothetical protein
MSLALMAQAGAVETVVPELSSGGQQAMRSLLEAGFHPPSYVA